MKYIANLSFGKDSLAQIIMIKRLGLPLDEVIYCGILFSPPPSAISGEHPLMAEWIPKAEKILKREFDIDVRHIKAEKSFVEYFHSIKRKGNHIGDNYGFPYIIGAWCNSRLKVEPINKYLNSLNEAVFQYVGIAYDEPERYMRLKKQENNKHKYGSVLYDLKITEQKAFKICEPYNLISPVYSTEMFRGGCWFCVKQCLADLYLLWRNYPQYYKELVYLEVKSINTFKPNLSLSELSDRFSNGFVPTRQKKRKE